MLEYAAERGGNVDDPNKRDPLDFVLWQPSLDDEPAWESLWGPGRPGWHIECSALALRELGTTIDLHGGGTDLIFPHHECERAQSEAATGEPFVRHWMHQAMVRMDGEKMSKSLGNLVFVSDLRKEWDPMAIRLMIVENHYRTAWEWDDTRMPRAAERLERWRAAGQGDGGLEAVRAALDDDLDTPGAPSPRSTPPRRPARACRRPPRSSASSSDCRRRLHRLRLVGERAGRAREYGKLYPVARAVLVAGLQGALARHRPAASSTSPPRAARSSAPTTPR